MIGKLIRAEVGRRVGQRVTSNHSGLGGAVIGVAAPYVLRRMSARTGLLLAGAYAAKKLWDKKREYDRTQVRLDRVTRTAPAKALRPAPPLPETASRSSLPA